MNYSWLLRIISLMITVLPSPALAYIGFGPGMTFIGAFFSLVIGVVVILGMVLILPVRMWLKRRKAKKSHNKDTASSH